MQFVRKSCQQYQYVRGLPRNPGESGKSQARARGRREYRGMEFCRLRGWLTGHSRAGYAMDHLHRSSAYATSNVVHAPVSRNQRRHDPRLDHPLSRCGRRSGLDTPMGAADSRGSPLWSWSCFTIPGCKVRRPACASHRYGSSPLICQTPLALGEKVHICPFNEQS
jgi:hypothetical protein